MKLNPNRLPRPLLMLPVEPRVMGELSIMGRFRLNKRVSWLGIEAFRSGQRFVRIFLELLFRDSGWVWSQGLKITAYLHED